MRIRVTTRADLYEKRKQEHLERGYQIDEERPISVNGLCSFIAVRELPASDRLNQLVLEALNGNHAPGEDWEVLEGRSKSGFVLMDAVYVILPTTPNAMDTHRMGSAKAVNLCMSFANRKNSPNTTSASRPRNR